MKIVLLLSVLLISIDLVSAQPSLNDLEELQVLLKQRHESFAAYDSAIQQHSGIFGTVTKKDLIQSRDVLLHLVKTDDFILDKLNSVIETRGIAKGDYVIQSEADKQTINQLTAASDTLLKQLTNEKEHTESVQQKCRMQLWMLLASGALNFILLLLILMKRR